MVKTPGLQRLSCQTLKEHGYLARLLQVSYKIAVVSKTVSLQEFG